MQFRLSGIFPVRYQSYLFLILFIISISGTLSDKGLLSSASGTTCSPSGPNISTRIFADMINF